MPNAADPNWPGRCDKHEQCVDELLYPCAFHGCAGKKCGEDCLMGDIMGFCDSDENCMYHPSDIDCGNTFNGPVFSHIH